MNTTRQLETKLALSNGKEFDITLIIDWEYDEVFDAERDLDSPAERQAVRLGILEPLYCSVLARCNGLEGHASVGGVLLIPAYEDDKRLSYEVDLSREAIAELRDKLEGIYSFLNGTDLGLKR